MVQAGDRDKQRGTVSSLCRNVELKAQLASLDSARDVAHRLATDYVGLQYQVDTYFGCQHGRLKLREIDHHLALLIWYTRPDHAQARQSNYFLLDVSQPMQTKALLGAALGIRRTVKKHREIFLYSNVRIHLDQVEDLGYFLEFEAVLAEQDDPAQGYSSLRWLSQEFGIAAQDVIAGSYGDMD